MIQLPAHVLLEACKGITYRSPYVFLPDGTRLKRHQFDQLFIGVVFVSDSRFTAYASSLLPKRNSL